MDELTITEALAEIKTIQARVAKKRTAVYPHLCRQAGVRDPYELNGGADKVIRKEVQSVRDLEQRMVKLRSAIQKANDATTFELHGETRSISEWLIWRRDVAPGQRGWFEQALGVIDKARRSAMQSGFKVLQSGDSTEQASAVGDIVVNVSELSLSQGAEQVERLLGDLDGQLSLKNATVIVDI
jgi:hypothetical protein